MRAAPNPDDQNRIEAEASIYLIGPLVRGAGWNTARLVDGRRPSPPSDRTTHPVRPPRQVGYDLAMPDGPGPEQTPLLRRILEHPFDAAGAVDTFEARLAAENGWPLAFARRAIDEYRRFAFLYAADGRPVAPSDVVDQVWHLHLLYTRNYWGTFCPAVLGRPLHHEPAAGADGEGARLGDWYADTLTRYRSHFGDPPADIWPDPHALARRPKPRHVRVDVGSAAVVSRRAILAAAAGAVIVMIAGVAALVRAAME